MVNAFRLSKYLPGIPNDWTSVWDIGNVSNDDVLTCSEYLRVENNFICCICTLLEIAEIQEMTINNFENYGTMQYNAIWEDNQKLSVLLISDFVRDCLRERCWGRLSSNASYIHFGFDYYVYIGIELSESEVKKIAENYSLLVDMCPSPYATLASNE